MCGGSGIGFVKDLFEGVSAVAGAAVAAKGLFGGSDAPDVPRVTTPKAPSISDDDVQAAAEKERRRLMQAKGRKSTIKTLGQPFGNDDAGMLRPLLGGK